MKDIQFTYSSEELGWVGTEIELTGDTYFLVLLKDNKRGRVTVKKRNGAGEAQPKIHVTPVTGPEFELLMTGESEGKYIQLVTSEEPEKMQYLEF